MKQDSYDDEEDKVLLAVLPVFRELARGAKLRSVDEVFDKHLAEKQKFLAEYRGQGGNENKPA